MSFDVYLQGFQLGRAAAGDGAGALEVLHPFVETMDESFAAVATSDGGAELYGMDDLSSGFSIHGMSGDAIWQVIVDAAAAAGFFIMPVGCSVGVPMGVDRMDLPSELRASAVDIQSGQDLKELIFD